MATTYSFVEQLERGLEGEIVLDQYFSYWYHITPATLEEQKNKKIDRWFRSHNSRSDLWTAVEYKTDDKTDKTGNIFLETWSNYDKRRPGWVYSTYAERVIYYALPDTIYIFHIRFLRESVERYKSLYGERSVKNIGYESKGIPVPVETIEKELDPKYIRRLT